MLILEMVDEELWLIAALIPGLQHTVTDKADKRAVPI